MESVLYLRRNDSGELCIATDIPPLSEPIVTLIEVTADSPDELFALTDSMIGPTHFLREYWSDDTSLCHATLVKVYRPDDRSLPMKARCETCTYWVPMYDVEDNEVELPSNVRLCSINPPTVMESGGLNVWPTTTSKSVCGAWQNRDVS